MISFDSAIKIGVDIIETDLRVTKDNILVTHHDSSVTRTTDGTGDVRDYTFEDLQSLNAGHNYFNESYIFRDKHVSIPSLLELIKKYPKMRFNVDIKDNDPRVPELLNDLIIDYDAEEQIIVGSFYPRQIKRLRELNNNLTLIATINYVASYYFNNLVGLGSLSKITNFDVVQIPQTFGPINLMKPHVINGLQKLNLPIHVWTVDTIQELRKMLQLGVDGIFTNDPELCINYLQKDVEITPQIAM
ncbi:MAG: glycerophosphodiester phosphodiesterase [Candidatus Heimdallarchaeota archaeon]|nr:glycerophosphodiester phosphodiesterase [Candidatus Heimdallarchaeota archaeon]